MTRDDAEAADAAHADIGIVCALPIEVAAFLDRCERKRKYAGGEFVFRGGVFDGIRIAVVECGMGFARARRATHALIDAHTPKWLLSCGFSGALLPEMKVGDVVMARSICDQHGQELSVDVKVANDPARGLYVGRILTADELVRTGDEKKALAAKYDAIAVDLESLAVAQVARDANMRFLAVRVISDDLSSDLPPEILTVVGATGSLRLGAALGSFWKRPSSVKDMWQLRESAQNAAEHLAAFLEGVVVQLHSSK